MVKRYGGTFPIPIQVGDEHIPNPLSKQPSSINSPHPPHIILNVGRAWRATEAPPRKLWGAGVVDVKRRSREKEKKKRRPTHSPPLLETSCHHRTFPRPCSRPTYTPRTATRLAPKSCTAEECATWFRCLNQSVQSIFSARSDPVRFGPVHPKLFQIFFKDFLYNVPSVPSHGASVTI